MNTQTAEQGQSTLATPTTSALLGSHNPDQDQRCSEARGRGVLVGPFLADPQLAFAADVVDDLERTRDANANRLRVMTRTEPDDDGEMRGFGLDASNPDVARLNAIVETLYTLTAEATKNLERAVRAHPLGPWIKAQKGLGDKQAGRLLAAVGDPYWNTLHDRPRTVSELWAYCGLHTDGMNAVRRRKGQVSNWSADAKMRAWLCIGSCLKQINPGCKGDSGIGQHIPDCTCSPYRIVVDERRARTLITRPEWTAGHSLNDGIRVASKQLLKDLWIQARALHT